MWLPHGDAKMKDNINRTPLHGLMKCGKNGYTNLMYYTSASWIDENNLRGKGPVKTAQFGLEISAVSIPS